MNLGLSFLRGMVAAVNPCGFVLLPTYLMYFLGLEATRRDSQRASVRRALLVSASVTAGFMAVFVAVGAISTWFTSWIVEHAKYVTGVVGVVLVVLGTAMLFGYKLPFATPVIGMSDRDRTVRSMFVYGIAYATVSLSCTLVLFIPTMFATGERDGVVAGVLNGSAFALGMGLLVTALTVTLAVANHAVLRVLRSSMHHVQTIAAAFVVLSGAVPRLLLLGGRRERGVGPPDQRRGELPDPGARRAQRQLARRGARARCGGGGRRGLRRPPTAAGRRPAGSFARS